MTWFFLVTNNQLQREIDALNERIDQLATQDDVNALTTQVQQVASDLDVAKTSLQAEIDKLASGNPNLDLTALQAAVQPLDSAVQALGTLQPTPPPATA